MRNRFVVMGVSGCGKSTVARMLAERTGGAWLDADDFHPASNKVKMAAGIPLVDEDRWEWLQVLNLEMKRQPIDRPFFLACSVLRQVYRDRLADDIEVGFIYLKGSPECIRARLLARNDHFMPPALLNSQFATLEEPTDAVVVSIEQQLDDVVGEALNLLV